MNLQGQYALAVAEHQTVSMFAGCLQPRPRAESAEPGPSHQLVCMCGSVGGNWCRDDKGKRGAPGTAPDFTSSAFLPAHRASARSDGGPPTQEVLLPWAAECTGGPFLQLQKASRSPVSATGTTQIQAEIAHPNHPRIHPNPIDTDCGAWI